MSGPEKIASLSTEQEAWLPFVCEKWLKTGLSTEPASREEAEELVRELYTRNGFSTPEAFIWLDSPLQGVVAASLLAHTSTYLKWSALRAPLAYAHRYLDTKVEREVQRSVERDGLRILKEQIGDAIRSLIFRQFRQYDGYDQYVYTETVARSAARAVKGVRRQVPARLWRGVEEVTRGTFWEKVVAGGKHRLIEEDDLTRRSPGFYDPLLACLYGSHESRELPFFDFFRLGCGLEPLGQLRPYFRMCEVCGWWWPYADFVILTERPALLRRDASGALHCGEGPALAYPDGWSLYAWHGQQLPPEIFEGRGFEATRRILGTPNVETRRLWIELYGQEKFLRDSGARIINADEFGVLFRQEIPGDEPLVMVRVRNSTPEADGSFKDYYLRVPPGMRTAREAVAWTFRMGAEDYKPVQET